MNEEEASKRLTELRNRCIIEISEIAQEMAKNRFHGKNPDVTEYLMQQSHYRLLFIHNLLKAWFDALPKLFDILESESLPDEKKKVK